MEVHAHDVLNMIAASETGYTRASLAEAMRGRFGPDARFQTCSGGGMTAEELVAFIDERGKLAGPDHALRLAPDGSCACDE